MQPPGLTDILILAYTIFTSKKEIIIQTRYRTNSNAHYISQAGKSEKLLV